MDRQYYLSLAESGLSMPIGADLLMHEHSDMAGILLDGYRLGRILEDTARHFATPLAVPHMDLDLEKKVLCSMIGIAPPEIAKFHFKSTPDAEISAHLNNALKSPLVPAMQAQVDAIRYIADHTDLLPIGMSIGPFSLVTKLVEDPITPVCMAGTGMTGENDQDILMIEEVLELGMQIIQHNIKAQIEAGARAIFIAEPAANKVYFSPNQIEAGSDIFDRYVMSFNHRIKTLLDLHGVDLIFHCCGELIDYMVRQFATLDPAVMSLGSSRTIWEDARLVKKNTVLYGNLPSKQFYSDDLISAEDVIHRGEELIQRMRQVGHPFILGSECDVLSVPGCHETIMRKAEAITRCSEINLKNLVKV